MRIIDRRFVTGFLVTLALMTLSMLLAACDRGEIPGYDGLQRYVRNNPVGRDTDQWIEKRGMTGEWDRTGLIFGYINDQEECLKAIAGLKQADPAAEYRCTAANLK